MCNCFVSNMSDSENKSENQSDISDILSHSSDTGDDAFLDNLDQALDTYDGSSTSDNMSDNENTSADTVRQANHAHNISDESDILQDFFEHQHQSTHYQTTHKQYLINSVFTNNWGTKTETEDNLNNLETILTEVTVDMGMEAFQVNMFYGTKWNLFKQLYTKYRQDIHLSEGKEIVVMKFMVDMLGLIGTTFQPQSSESTTQFQPQISRSPTQFTTHFTTQPLRF